MGTVLFDYEDAPHASSMLTTTTNVVGREVAYTNDDQPIHSGGAPAAFAQAIGARMRIDEVRLPHDPTTAFYTFAYDSEARVRSVTNARTTAPGPGVWTYYPNSGRSMMRDPAGWKSYEYYDLDGRLIASNNGRTVSETWYDGIGRTRESRAGFTFYDVYRDQVGQTFYDANHNAVISRALPIVGHTGAHLSTSSVLDSVAQYNYSAFPSLVTREIDGNGNGVNYCYQSTQAAHCSGVQVDGADGLLRGVFGEEGEETLTDYDSAGRITRVRVRAD